MVVGGRVDSDNNVTSVIDCYDENLTHSTPVEYSSALYGIGSASLGDMSVFAGGHNKGSSCVNTVNAYDINLTRTVASTGLNNARYSVCGGSIGNHAVFMGGSNSSSTRYTDVHFYDRSLTRTKRTTSQFSDAYSSTMCATNITGYLIVNVGAQLFSINEELTKKTIGNASATRHYGEYATSVDDYAVFANGVTASNSDSNIVDTVDANLTLVKGATTISTGRANNALATSLKGFALFTGGDVCTDVLDNSLTNTIMPPISTAHGNGGCSETIGDYALFFGGYVDSARTNMVDAYVCL